MQPVITSDMLLMKQAVIYPLAKNGVFCTLQGEGVLSGMRMVFIRLAGCSVGCAACDTDYKLKERVTLTELLDRVDGAMPPSLLSRWVWITGGEPLDHDINPLVLGLKRRQYKVALATSGHMPSTVDVDFLSVSPHSPKTWVQRSGDELKIIPGLNGVKLEDFDFSAANFRYKYVQPLEVGNGRTVNREECLQWCETHPNWLMTEQNHKRWGLP